MLNGSMIHINLITVSSAKTISLSQSCATQLCSGIMANTGCRDCEMQMRFLFLN